MSLLTNDTELREYIRDYVYYSNLEAQEQKRRFQELSQTVEYREIIDKMATCNEVKIKKIMLSKGIDRGAAEKIWFKFVKSEFTKIRSHVLSDYKELLSKMRQAF